MRVQSPYMISFSGLPVGEHVFEFEITPKFQEKNPIEDISDLNASVILTLHKMNHVLKANYQITGTYTMDCDRCNLPFKHKFDVLEEMFVKNGISTGDEPENVVLLPENVFELNVEPYIYEFITLSVPKRRVHAEGDCDPEVIEKLNALSVVEIPDVDPRWNVLKNVKF
jgi:uncharacterized metal-binding protein YceD (DUF177 family)